MPNLQLAAALRAAKKNSIPETELQVAVEEYKKDGPNKGNLALRHIIINGCSWLPASMVVDRGIRAGNWELGLDQLQAGTVALLQALDTYDVTKGASFLTHAHNWVRPALNAVFKSYQSVVHQGSGAAMHDMSLDAPLGDDSRDTLGEIIPSPQGSTLDALIRLNDQRDADSAESGQRVKTALERFNHLSDKQRAAVQELSGLSNRAFRISHRNLRKEFGVTSYCMSSTRNRPAPIPKAVPAKQDGMIPLTPALCASFIEMKQRRGVSIQQVTDLLSAELIQQGMNNSAASAYTVLHAATPSKNQQTVNRQVVAALRKVYTQLPETHYTPNDPEYQALQGAITQHKLTASDLLGITRSKGLAYGSDEIKGIYHHIEAGHHPVPKDVVDPTMAALKTSPAGQFFDLEKLNRKIINWLAQEKSLPNPKAKKISAAERLEWSTAELQLKSHHGVTLRDHTFNLMREKVFVFRETKGRTPTGDDGEVPGWTNVSWLTLQQIVERNYTPPAARTDKPPQRSSRAFRLP